MIFLPLFPSVEKCWSLSHVWLLVTPWLWPTSLLSPWNFPGTGTRVGSHFLLHGIFPTQNQTWADFLLPQNLTINREKNQGVVIVIFFFFFEVLLTCWFSVIFSCLKIIAQIINLFSQLHFEFNLIMFLFNLDLQNLTSWNTEIWNC